MSRFRIVAGVLMFAVVSGAVLMYLLRDDGDETVSEVSQKAPGFTLPDASGKNISLEALEGDVKVITFWASWSPYSRDELNSLARLKEEYGSKVSVAALNRDTDSSEGRTYLESLNLGDALIFAFDKDDEYFKKVNGYAMPETIFLDTEGNIVAHQRGPMTYEEMRAQIEFMLN